MSASDLFRRADEAARAIRAAMPDPAKLAIVLGSGLGGFVDTLADRVVLPYAELRHFPLPTVAGHQGNLVIGTIGGVRLVVLQGRLHFYEGHNLETVTFPIRVLERLGVKALILTSAVGGLGETFRPGEIVSVCDHLNLLGVNPLRGPNDDRFGPRFPDMTEVYSPRLRRLASAAAAELGLSLHEGVYACMPGPSYETPAEINMLRTLGADVVGMSTVPEAIVARHAGMEVLALAVVSNWAAGIAGTPITHDEVIEAGKAAGPKVAALVRRVVGRWRGTEQDNQRTR